MKFCSLTGLIVLFQSICFLTLATPQTIYSQPLKINTSAESVVLMNADTGVILYEKNAHAPQFPASITKIATASLALKKKGDALNTSVVAEQESIASITPDAKRKANYKNPAYWVEMGSSHIGIKKGEELTFKTLLYGLMLASANDAANVIAQYVSGNIPEFVKEMNVYVESLGCKNTHFCNPHGLHHPDHKTTAYDMALITQDALRNPLLREIVSTVKYTRPKTNKQEATTMVQHNRLLKKGPYNYSKAFGVKTGYTSLSHHTFVGAAQNEGRTLIAVVLNAKESGDTFQDTINLFDAAFKESKVERTLVAQGPQKVTLQVASVTKPIPTYVKNPITVKYYPSEEPKLKAVVTWEKTQLPVNKDDHVGLIQITGADGKVMYSTSLYASEDAETKWDYGALLIGALVLFGIAGSGYYFMRKNA